MNKLGIIRKIKIITIMTMSQVPNLVVIVSFHIPQLESLIRTLEGELSLKSEMVREHSIH